MNKYPKRKYNNIKEVYYDADLDLNIRYNSIQIYDGLMNDLNTKGSIKDNYKSIAMNVVNKTINQYINNERLK